MCNSLLLHRSESLTESHASGARRLRLLVLRLRLLFLHFLVVPTPTASAVFSVRLLDQLSSSRTLHKVHEQHRVERLLLGDVGFPVSAQVESCRVKSRDRPVPTKLFYEEPQIQFE